jgi:hypothetical protein
VWNLGVDAGIRALDGGQQFQWGLFFSGLLLAASGLGDGCAASVDFKVQRWLNHFFCSLGFGEMLFRRAL